MEIRRIETHKERYMALLLEADESPAMIARYLGRGTLYALFEETEEPCAVAVVTDEGDGVFELKNLAVRADLRRCGYGRRMVEWLCTRYAGCGRTMQVGTGDSPLTIPFYERCGFRYSHRVPGFFTAHYDHPIVEAGVQLVDMVYLRRGLG